MNLTKEQRLRHYVLFESIGQGAMSVVYRAYDEKFSRDVAVKVLHPFLAEKAEYRRRLYNEAEAVSCLLHPNIVQVYDYAKDEGSSSSTNKQQLFVVSELVDGVTLKVFADKQRIWEIPELGAYLGWILAKALAHAHAHGILHRDIKPENVMVGHDGIVKLMDFGMAKSGAHASLTMTGTLVGSPAYMAPEIIEGRRGDQRSDVYSLAVVLYYLCTGMLPYTGDNPHSLMRAVVLGNALPASDVSSKVTVTLSRVIEQGMALNPEARHADANAFATEIGAALAEGGVDVGELRLADLLYDLDGWQSKIIDGYVKGAKTFLVDARPAAAFALLSRVLATEPNNAVALGLLKETPSPRNTAALFRSIFWAGGACLFISVCLAIYYVVDWPRVDSNQKSIPRASVAVGTDEKKISNDVGMTATSNEMPKSAISSLAPSLPERQAIPAVGNRSVIFNAVPFADIYIDGQLMAREAHELKLDMPLGHHVVLFRHRYAESIEKQFELQEGRGSHIVRVTLDKPKPALLRIHSDVDADIAIAGMYKGSTANTVKMPVMISMPKFAHMVRLEVIVSQKGFVPYVKEHAFHAGETTTIDVHLEPRTP
jgi:serine/threonine-protein kinase